VFKKLFYLIILLLLCSSCVSRTINKEPGLTGGNEAKGQYETKLVWFWDKDF
jgi:hypothetical protein